ncbi:MAG: MATE family efflux transporter [Spartobacteria bacterium]
MRSFIPTRDDLRRTVRLAAPVAFVQVGMMTMGMVDIIMVGHVSGTALAAVALGNLYFFGTVVFGLGVVMALDPIIAQAVGADDDLGVTRGVQRGMILALALTLPASAILLPAAPVLHWLAQPADVVPVAALYAWINIPGIFPFFAFLVLRQTLQAQHRMRPIVLTIIVSNLLNAGLDWAFIFGHLGLPASGVAGAAWATTISRWFMAFAMLGAGWSSLSGRLFPIRPGALEFAPLWRMFVLGAPIGIQIQIEYGAFAVIGLLMGWLGTEQLAGHQVALNLASFTFMVPLGIGAAAAVLVGNAIGRDDAAGARRHAGAALVCGTAFMVLSAILFIAIPTRLAALYTTEAGVLVLAARLIPIAGVFQVFDGLQVVAGGILRGAGDTRVPMVINLVAFWVVMMPLCFFLAFRTSLGASGLWWGLVGGLGSVALLLLLRIRHRFGKELRRVLVDEPAPAEPLG